MNAFDKDSEWLVHHDTDYGTREHLVLDRSALRERRLIAGDFSALRKLAEENSNSSGEDLGEMVYRTNDALAKTNGTKLRLEDDSDSTIGISKIAEGGDIYRIDKDGSVKAQLYGFICGRESPKNRKCLSPIASVRYSFECFDQPNRRGGF
jgi:hypothetical protein